MGGSSKELDAISTLFRGGNHVFLKGLDATETAFKENIEQCNLAHFAVHGRGDSLNAFNSYLLFRDQQDMKNDGQLHAYELYQMNLQNLKLAVLSACESGIGKELKGEGIFNIARGFAYAGCASTIISMWNINDAVTAQLMESLYVNLRRGTAGHQALRKAKLDYIQNAEVDKLAHPFYWAGFVPVGDTPAFSSSRCNLFITIISIILLTILIFIIYRKWRM